MKRKKKNKKERERDRQTDRHREIQRERETERELDRDRKTKREEAETSVSERMFNKGRQIEGEDEQRHAELEPHLLLQVTEQLLRTQGSMGNNEHVVCIEW